MSKAIYQADYCAEPRQGGRNILRVQIEANDFGSGRVSLCFTAIKSVRGEETELETVRVDELHPTGIRRLAGLLLQAEEFAKGVHE